MQTTTKFNENKEYKIHSRPWQDSSDDEDDNKCQNASKAKDLYKVYSRPCQDSSDSDIDSKDDCSFTDLFKMSDRKQISWTKSIFSFDTQYAVIRQSKHKIKIYEYNSDLKMKDVHSPQFISTFLGIEKNASILETVKDIDYSLMGIGYRSNSYSIDLETLQITQNSIPIWIVVATKDKYKNTMCQMLTGQINIINNHMYIKQCAASLSYNSITAKCNMFVFGLDLFSELELKKETESFGIKVVAKTKRLGFSPIITHFKKSFPKYGKLFNAFSLFFSPELECKNFQCTVSSKIASGDNKKNDTKSDNKYSIDLSFQPALNPNGMIVKFLDFIGFKKYEEFEEMFPLKLYLKGGNDDGYKIGAELGTQYTINKWLFPKFIRLHSFDWKVQVEATDNGNVTTSVCAGINGFINLSEAHKSLPDVTLRGHIKPEIKLNPPGCSVEMGFAVQFSGAGWDPFSVMSLRSDCYVKSMYMAYGIEPGPGIMTFPIRAGGNLNFMDSNVIMTAAIKVIVSPAPPPAFVSVVPQLESYYFEIDELDPKELILKLGKSLNLDKKVLDVIKECPKITAKNCIFSCNLTTDDMKVPYGIKFTKVTGDEEKEVTYEQAMQNLDCVKISHKETEIKVGLRMKGSINIMGLLENQGEMEFSPDKITMKLDINAYELHESGLLHKINDMIQDALNSAKDDAIRELEYAKREVKNAKKDFDQEKERAEKQLNDAKDAVHSAHNAFEAEKERARRQLQNARDDVSSAASAFEYARRESDRGIRNAQREVNSLNNDIRDAHRELAKIKKNWLKAFEAPYHASKIAALETAKFTALAALEVARETARGALYGSQFASLETAKAALLIAEHSYDGILTGTQYASLETAKLALMAAKETYKGILEGSKWAAIETATLGLNIAKETVKGVMNAVQTVTDLILSGKLFVFYCWKAELTIGGSEKFKYRLYVDFEVLKQRVRECLKITAELVKELFEEIWRRIKKELNF